MSVTERVQQSASLNEELLDKLRVTEPGHLSLPQSQDQTSTLQHEVNTTASTLQKLKSQTAKELKDLQDQRDSSVRKRLYKFSGQKEKFEAKTEKEKAEYLEAFEREKQANEKLENLRANLANAQKALADHEEASKQHVSLQNRLNDLYNSIFEGPTREYPDEDNLEQRFNAAKEDFEIKRSSYQEETEVVKLLDQAESVLRRAISEMGNARDASSMDAMGGGAMVSMMKRDAMDRAQMSATRAEKLMRQAQERSKHVQGLASLNFNFGGGTMDVFFDNINMAVRDEIIRSQDRLMNASRMLSQQIRQAYQRQDTLQQQLNEAADAMEGARRDLQRRREEIFQELTNAPPAYSQPEPQHQSQYPQQAQSEYRPQAQSGRQSQAEAPSEYAPPPQSAYHTQPQSGYQPQPQQQSWYNS